MANSKNLCLRASDDDHEWIDSVRKAMGSKMKRGVSAATIVRAAIAIARRHHREMPRAVTQATFDMGPKRK